MRAISSLVRASAIPAILSISFSTIAFAQVEPPLPPIVTPDDARLHGLESLRTVVENEGVPLPDGLDKYIKNYEAARVLGRALFFENAVGSDGVQSCASCHFNAGADSRSRNQMSPGLLRVRNDRNGDVVGFHNAANDEDTSFDTRGPNSTLERGDFPFVKDIGVGAANGANVIDSGGTISPAPGNTNDVSSSMGVFLTYFQDISTANDGDDGYALADDVFNVANVNTRRVEPRNTPTTVNAIFNFVNFWDGRGNNRFNGENPFGKQDKVARAFKSTRRGRKIISEPVSLQNASLASQASGPPLSHFEMSFGNGSDNFRIFPQLGRKLVNRRVLEDQFIAPDDSMFADWRHPSGYGLTVTYEELIQQAFRNRYWNFNKYIQLKNPELSEAPGNLFSIRNGDKTRIVNNPGPDAFSQMEANFSLYYGITVMLYEATLVADASPFDNWMRGLAEPGFGEQELAGLNVFVNEGKCIACHVGAGFSAATVRAQAQDGVIIEPMIMGDRLPALYDNGFYNIGVTPTVDDLGRGAKDPHGAPLSFSRQFAFQALGIEDINFEILGSPIPGLVCDPADPGLLLDIPECANGVIGFNDIETGLGFFPVCRDLNGDGLCSPADELLLQRVAVDGAFKTPQLRNVAETAPYFHNGSVATLLEVVQFYNRGGNFCQLNGRDLDPAIQPLGLTAEQEQQLVAFLMSLSDPRVPNRQAPFDNPEFKIPNGHPDNDVFVGDDMTGQGFDEFLTVDAVGVGGGAPFPAFLGGVDHFTANTVDGGVCNANFAAAP